jgi:RAP domain
MITAADGFAPHHNSRLVPTFYLDKFTKRQGHTLWTTLQESRKQPSKAGSSDRKNSHRKQHSRPSRGNDFIAKAIARNKKIVELGKKQQWKKMLIMHEQESSQFDTVNYATMMSQLGRIRYFDRRDPLFQQFMDELALKIETDGQEWSGRDMANIAHSIAKMQLRSHTAKRILSFVSTPDSSLQLLFQSGTRSVANTAWAFATLRTDAPRFFSAIEYKSDWLVEEGNPQDVANTAWAFATLGMCAPKLFSAIEQKAHWLLEEGKPQAVANTAWAFATLGMRAPKLFSAIDQKAHWLLDEGNPQDVANTAWAFATLGMRAPKLFSAIDQKAHWLLDEGNPQDVANTAWAFATLGMRAPKLFSAIDQKAHWLLEEGKPQEVANTAWAFATLGMHAPKLFSAIEQKADWLLEEGDPQAVANTAWAFATLRTDAPRFFSAIEYKSDWLVEEGNPQDVANTASAFATLGMRAPKLFSAIEQRANWLLEEGNPQNVANTAWAFAKLGIDAPKLFSAIEKQAAWLTKEGDSQAITMICFSIAILNLFKQYEHLLNQLWAHLMNSGCIDSLDVDQVCQVVQTYAMASEVRFTLQKPDISAIPAKTVRASRAQIEVSTVLAEIGFTHVQEVSPYVACNENLLPRGMLSIDIANTKEMIAIEFDGPHHFVVDISTGAISENGATKAKRRLLKQLGWKVFNINYIDWGMAKGKEEKKAFLRSLLLSS